MSYTGGAFGVTIEDSYTYDDFERDMDECAVFALAMDRGDEGVAIAEVILHPEVVDAFGRATAYAERTVGD